MNQSSAFHSPLVSVIMPLYNARAFVADAIKSIQAQTYPHWELIIVDDLSDDGSWELATTIAQTDERITVYRNGRHRGVAGAANLALPLAKGMFIARMDSDDLALPDRLAKQVAFLQTNPQVVVVGGQCELINAAGDVTGFKAFPTDTQHARRMMFTSVPVQQPSMMVNRSLLPADFVWYEEGLNTAEEVELLFKFFQYGEVTNLPDTILQYRIHGNNISLKDPKKTFYLTLKTRLLAIKRYGYRPTLTGVVTSLVQFAIVSVLPAAWIYPLYSLVRGLKQKSTVHLSRLFRLATS